MTETEIDGRLWISKIHLVPLPGLRPFPSPEVVGAYTNCITVADNEVEFKGKVKALLSLEGFDVTDFEHPETLLVRASGATSAQEKEALSEILNLVRHSDLTNSVATTEVYTYENSGDWSN